MSTGDRFQKVSASPTRPGERPGGRTFDVADLFKAAPVEPAAESTEALDERLRQAYFWITNHAIINPFYDIAYNQSQPARFVFGDAKVPVELPTDQSYSSYVLLPLLTLALRGRCLLVGGPGRGKTAIAVLMGVLAGYPLRDVRRAIQHGQPQMTVADLLGNPLPSSLMQAKSGEEVTIAWRRWLGMRVKIVDEYNRIPTRTQSGLLTVMADGYAELYDQIYECPESAWYLTANDDAGGGTYQVIEALRDRIDVVVKALHFNTRFLDELLLRIEEGVRPEEVVPGRLVFTADQLDRMHAAIRAVALPPQLLRRLAFFASQFEFCESAGRQFEYLTKDTAKLAGVDPGALGQVETGKDKLADLGAQTVNGFSVRALMTCIAYIKAMAWFRGQVEASFEDVRQMVPFVLHDKLVQHAGSPVFEAAHAAAFRTDRIAWIRSLFDAACAEYDRLDRDRRDPVGEMLTEIGSGLEGLDGATVRSRLARIEGLLREWAGARKLSGHLYDDILTLKYLHQRYTNYLRWLTWKR